MSNIPLAALKPLNTTEEKQMNDLNDNDCDQTLIAAVEWMLKHGSRLGEDRLVIKKNDDGGYGVRTLEDCGDDPYVKWLQRQFPKSQSTEDNAGQNSALENARFGDQDDDI